jgi:hypothetical protein
MSRIINPKLKVGDRIVCVDMEDEPNYVGKRGTVTNISKGPRFIQYNVKWDDGGGLFLLDTDKWIYEKDFKRKSKVNESKSVGDLANDSKILKYFKMLKIKKYLDLLQKTSVTNMFGASPYLYIGKDILRKEHYNQDSPEFDELLELSEDVKSIMIRGAMSILEDEGKEITPETVTRTMQRWAPKVLNFWMTHY